MTGRPSRWRRALADWLGGRAEARRTHERELHAAALDALTRCGLTPADIQVQAYTSERTAGAVLIVTVRCPAPELWQHSTHVEAYVTDRLQRRSAYPVARVMLVRWDATALDPRAARRGVRRVHAALHGGHAPLTTGPLHAAPDEGVPSSVNGAGESSVQGLDIVHFPALPRTPTTS